MQVELLSDHSLGSSTALFRRFDWLFSTPPHNMAGPEQQEAHGQYDGGRSLLERYGNDQLLGRPWSLPGDFRGRYLKAACLPSVAEAVVVEVARSPRILMFGMW